MTLGIFIFSFILIFWESLALYKSYIHNFGTKKLNNVLTFVLFMMLRFCTDENVGRDVRKLLQLGAGDSLPETSQQLARSDYDEYSACAHATLGRAILSIV